VVAYEDRPLGILTQEAHGSGQFKEVTLHPRVQISDAAQLNLLPSLHELAGQKCFIANSVRFPVHCFSEAHV
jgi:organic hydroperoxide reductase OsmC/OhrA